VNPRAFEVDACDDEAAVGSLGAKKLAPGRKLVPTVAVAVAGAVEPRVAAVVPCCWVGWSGSRSSSIGSSPRGGRPTGGGFGVGPAVLDATEPSRLGRLALAGGFLRFGTNRGPDLSAGGGGAL
jgi:hypothetical protein